MEPELTSEIAKISITDPLIKDKKFSKHVLYNITGTDNKGSFQIQRRYKEFNALRISLLHQWPGCYVPMIPPKKMIGNLQNDFIEQRRKLLEIFLIKICEIFFLFDCEEFQLFIRGPADFIKALGKKKVTYAEIAEKYQGAFQISNETIEEANIMDSENYLKLSLGKLESFENICKKNALNYEKYTQYLEGGLRSLGKVNESYQMYGKRFNDFPSRNDYSNPFHVMLQWTRIEILDFQAILEVISQRNEYVKIREKINEKVGNEQRNLSKIQTGKKSLGQKLANKSNSEQITEIETHIQEFIKELNMAKIIEEIITFRLVQIYLPGFRQKNSLAFSHSLWDFIQSNTKETNSLITQSAQISSIYLEN